MHRAAPPSSGAGRRGDAQFREAARDPRTAGALRRRRPQRGRIEPQRALRDRSHLPRQCRAEGCCSGARCGRTSARRQFRALRRGARRRPGIYSARWAGGSRDFRAAISRIEQELRAARARRPWQAHFISALALAWPDGRIDVFEGRVDGDLVFPARGTAGFGYDPIFRPDGHERTFGEMSAEEKHGIPPDGSLALSHRARAFQKFACACL